MDNIVFLSFGANIGERETNINNALSILNDKIGPLIKRSSFYYSKPVGFDSTNDFCNICASFHTSLSPLDLLYETQDTERTLGRNHKTIISKETLLPIYSDRSIDIDIILYFKATLQRTSEFPHNYKSVNMRNNTLIIPHPKYSEREFVTIPLHEIYKSSFE